MASENVDRLLLALRDNESLMLELSAVLAKLKEISDTDLTNDELSELFTELASLTNRETWLPIHMARIVVDR